MYFLKKTPEVNSFINKMLEIIKNNKKEGKIEIIKFFLRFKRKKK